MGEDEERTYQSPCSVPRHDFEDKDDQWVNMEVRGGDGDHNKYTNRASSGPDNSSATDDVSSSSSDAVGDDDDASSSTSCSCSSSNSMSPLFELSELMAHLPIKQGISKFYQGKSQSFASLSNVTSIEELVKKKTSSFRRKVKASKSYGNGLDFPKPIIAKKVTRGSSVCFSGRRAGGFLNQTRPPPIPIPIPIQKK